MGTGIRMGVYVRNLVVRGFHWTTGSDCGPKPFLRHMSVHLTVWRSKGPYNRPYFIWLLSNQIGCEQPDLVHEGIPVYSYKTCFREWQIAPNLIEKAPLQFLSTLTAKGASFGVKWQFWCSSAIHSDVTPIWVPDFQLGGLWFCLFSKPCGFMCHPQAPRSTQLKSHNQLAYFLCFWWL